MRRVTLALLVLMVLTLSLAFVVYLSSPLEIDATVVVAHIVDGDTFDVSSGERIRLADVDTPEYGESGYLEAKEYLISLIYGKEIYLDVDNFFRTDKYGRLVCLVYVEYDSTDLLNVNKALLDAGLAVARDYPNEFSPYAWALYCSRTESMQKHILIPIFLLAAVSSGITAAIIHLRTHKAKIVHRPISFGKILSWIGALNPFWPATNH